MELKDFISNTLTQLIDGIADAQEHANSKGAIVNPEEKFPSDFNKMSRLEKSFRLVHIIDFDVALTVAEDKQLKGGMGIVVAALGLGYQAQSDSQKSVVSRVQFAIPVVLPTQRRE